LNEKSGKQLKIQTVFINLNHVLSNPPCFYQLHLCPFYQLNPKTILLPAKSLVQFNPSLINLLKNFISQTQNFKRLKQRDHAVLKGNVEFITVHWLLKGMRINRKKVAR
jgi:hypothetical protein